jgi:hypothetical protein
MGRDQVSEVQSHEKQLQGAPSYIYGLEAKGGNAKEVDEALAKRSGRFKKSVEHDSIANHTSVHTLHDGTTDPRDTGNRLGKCLENCLASRGMAGKEGVSRI